MELFHQPVFYKEVGLTTSLFRRRGRTGRILREKASRHISHVLEKRFRQKRVPAKGILRRRARGVLRKGPLRRSSFMSDLAFGESGPERRAGHSTFKPPPCTMVCKQLPSIDTDMRQHNIQPRTAILAAFALSDAMAGAPNPSNRPPMPADPWQAAIMMGPRGTSSWRSKWRMATHGQGQRWAGSQRA